MRDQFHEDLDTISDQLVELTRLAGSAISRATTALLDADVHLAESVIEADRTLDDIRIELDELSIDLLARQQPVATDLRIVVTAMHMSSDLERMGDLARHVAKVARLRTPDSAVPPELRSHILQMGQVAEAKTNDLGEYRLFGLEPGTYTISAERYLAPRIDGTFYLGPTPPCPDCMGEGEFRQQVATLLKTGAYVDPRVVLNRSYPMVYFPAAPDRAGATPVTARSGVVTSGIDLRLVVK